jgi:hypothetical protein
MVIVSTPKNSRTALGIVTVLARTMLAYERLERLGAISPRASSRRAASTSVSPVVLMSVPEAIRRPYRLGRANYRARIRPAAQANTQGQFRVQLSSEQASNG